jgi:predicted nucleotidyltransferase
MDIIDGTPYPELNTALRELVSGISEIIGDNFIGAYLQGSFAVGDFDEHSDCDFVIVINDELDQSHIAALQSMHHRIFNLGLEWAKHLEGSYFPRDILRDYLKSDRDLWYLDNGHSLLERSSHCNKVVVRSILREKGVILFGPNPALLIEPIPVEILRHEIMSSIIISGQKILDDPQPYNNRFYQGFIVLQWCRKWHNLHAGQIGSKRAGAEWAKMHLDKSWHDLIDRAWAGRVNPAESVNQPADKIDFRRTLEFVREVMRRVDDFASL